MGLTISTLPVQTNKFDSRNSDTYELKLRFSTYVLLAFPASEPDPSNFL